LKPKQPVPATGKVGGQTSVGGGLQLVIEVATCQTPPVHVAVVMGAGQPAGPLMPWPYEQSS